MPPEPQSFEVYIDRSLGRHIIAEALGGLGIVVRTEHDVFGDREVPVADEEWLKRAGREGWIVFSKDTKIRYRSRETEALVQYGVRAFVLSSGNLTGPEQAECFVRNIEAITAAAQQPGPFVYAVRRSAIERLSSP